MKAIVEARRHSALSVSVAGNPDAAAGREAVIAIAIAIAIDVVGPEFALIVVPTVTVLVAGAITLGVLRSVVSVVSVTIETAAAKLLASGGVFAGFVP